MASDSNISDRKEALLIFLGVAAAFAGSYVATNFCLLCEVSPSLFFIEALALLVGSMLCWSSIATRAECIARLKRYPARKGTPTIGYLSVTFAVFLLVNFFDYLFRVSFALADLDNRHLLSIGAFLSAKCITVELAIGVTSKIKVVWDGQ